MENKREEMKKSGVEFLKNLSISDISARTFIHEMELRKFLNAQFDGINKTKAMGFIQILQREFNIDLSDLRSQYLAYYDEQGGDISTPRPSMIMDEVKHEERKKGFFSFILLLGAIGAIAYLVNKYDLLNFTSPHDIKTAEVLNNKEVKDIQQNLQKLTQPQKPEIVQEVKKEEKVVASENTQADSSTQTDDSSKSDDMTQNTTTQTAETTNQNQQTNSNGLDLSKLNAELSQVTNDANTNQETQNEQETVTQDDTQNQEDDTSTVAIANDELYIVPSSKVWIGTIELDTLKKKDFLTPKGDRVDIDTSKNQLIMIGHKFIKIYLNGEVVKFKKRGPVRFKYVDGKLTEINRGEFNKLAKGRQW